MDKPAVPAGLFVDDHLQGEVGLASPDVYSELFRAGDGEPATLSM